MIVLNVHYTFLLLLFKWNEGYTEKGVWGLVLAGVRITGEAASLKTQEVVPVKGFLPHLLITQRRGGTEGRSAKSDDNQQRGWWKIGVKKQEMYSTCVASPLLNWTAALSLVMSWHWRPGQHPSSANQGHCCTCESGLFTARLGMTALIDLRDWRDTCQYQLLRLFGGL